VLSRSEGLVTFFTSQTVRVPIFTKDNLAFSCEREGEREGERDRMG
jgi:hypothetical protein